MDDEALEAALFPAPAQAAPEQEADWAKVEKDLSERGVTLKLLWEEWRETHPDGMSYPTWCRRFREWRPCRDATMRQNRRPGERLFVDYAGMTIPIVIDGVEHKAQVFVASMGISGRLYAEATLTQKIEDWCASHVRCFEDMGCVRQVVVPDNIKPAVIKPSRYEPILNETYADLLDHYGIQGFPARVRKPRDKGLVEQGVLHAERWILAPLRKHVFHDLASLNRAIAAQVRKINRRPYAEGAMRDQGASCSPYDSALARRSCSHAIASVRAHGQRSKARSTIRASPTMPPWRANIPAWPLRSARITSKPLIVA